MLYWSLNSDFQFMRFEKSNKNQSRADGQIWPFRLIQSLSCQRNAYPNFLKLSIEVVEHNTFQYTMVWIYNTHGSGRGKLWTAVGRICVTKFRTQPGIVSATQTHGTWTATLQNLKFDRVTGLSHLIWCSKQPSYCDLCGIPHWTRKNTKLEIFIHSILEM